MNIQSIWPTLFGFDKTVVSKKLIDDSLALSNVVDRVSPHQVYRCDASEFASDVVIEARDLMLRAFHEYYESATGLRRGAYEVGTVLKVRVYKQGERILPHYDNDSDFTVCLYLTDEQASESNDGYRHKGSGAIMFCDPRGYTNKYLMSGDQTLRIVPSAGDIVVFPATVLHETEPSSHDHRVLLVLAVTVRDHRRWGKTWSK